MHGLRRRTSRAVATLAAAAAALAACDSSEPSPAPSAPTPSPVNSSPAAGATSPPAENAGADSKDVTVTRCAAVAEQPALTATIRVTNNGAAAAAYSVTLAFFARDGKTLLESANTAVPRLPRGASAERTVTTVDAAVPATFTCTVVRVVRRDV